MTSSSAWALEFSKTARSNLPSTTSRSSTSRRAHPAREWSDTFYFTEDPARLRTQTSPMVIHAMETRELPIRILAPGRVYRSDEVDATHSPMFHQIEGMAIDKGITMADLKGTLNEVVRQLYGEHTVTRFRPHHFPVHRAELRNGHLVPGATAQAAPPARARAGSRFSAPA